MNRTLTLPNVFSSRKIAMSPSPLTIMSVTSMRYIRMPTHLIIFTGLKFPANSFAAFGKNFRCDIYRT
jgi:hypothetical protein